MSEPSKELIQRAQIGDAQALSELVQSQQHYVYSIAMSVLKNPDDAADITQEAFIRLFRSLNQYHGESRFTTWLYRLVVNLCRDELRRRGRQVSVLHTDDSAEEALDPLSLVADTDRWVDPAQSLDASELRDQVRQALDELEEHYRLVLTLYYFEEMKYIDIAEVLDIPLNTVKSHIRRGKERLAEILQSNEREQEEHPPVQGQHAVRTEQPARPLSNVSPLRLFARLGGSAV
ncbi:MAG: sigma-70 family RNA polymerase sigma factor [Chloroflexaceae bacterium]|nr:sigma-70 family RNA polymerase sigma factor [Chloroflexaceae bacterium]NJO06447.1 sigma-70 family RNA polymerase sigma factor [Chloroflexaceae bacterium]